MTITDYAPHMARDIADIYHQAIHDISDEWYTAEQREAWAPTPPDYLFWQSRLRQTQPYVAIDQHKIIGFIELQDHGYIDCFYVLPVMQGQGCGRALYLHLESKAKQQRLTCLKVDASKVAKPLFERFGFSVLQKNLVERHPVWLENYSMVKQLPSTSCCEVSESAHF